MKSNPHNLSRCISMPTFGHSMHTNFYTMLYYLWNRKNTPHRVAGCISSSIVWISDYTNCRTVQWPSWRPPWLY